MKQVINLLLVATLGLTAHQASFAREGYCKITEPKGGPLNARSKPDGKIINKLKNGRKVYVNTQSGYAYGNAGQPWVLVQDGNTHQMLGWVFREYISCY